MTVLSSRMLGVPRATGGVWSGMPLAGKGYAVLVTPVLALLISSGIFYYSLRLESYSREQVDHAIEVMDTVKQIDSDIFRAASAVYARFTIQEKGAMARYAKGKAAVQASVARLVFLTSNDIPRRELTFEVGRLVQKRLELLEEIAGHPDPLRGMPEAVEEGRQTMLALLAKLKEIRDETDKMLEEHRTALGQVTRQMHLSSLGVLVFGVVGGIASMLLFTSVIARRMEKLEETARSLTPEVLSLGATPTLDEIDRLHLVFEEVRRKLSEHEARLKEGEARFRMLYMDAPVPYQSLDEQGNFLAVNKTFCETLGYTSEELLGTSFAELLRPEMRQVFLERFPHHMNVGDIFREEFELRTKSGAFILVAYSGRIGTHPDGSFSQSHCVFRDVSRERAAEKALVQAKEAAEASDKAKTIFLANMSHELRTPLNGILGMLKLIHTTALNKEQTEYAEMALQSCNRLTRLLGDILDISRIEAGTLELREEPFWLPATFTAVEDLFSPAARQADVELTIEADPALPETLVGDEARLQQLLNNLVGNAVKFTSSGSIRVHVGLLPAGGDSRRARLLFSVADTGIGIPDNLQETLFAPFTQAESSYTRAKQGAGLGLAIVRDITREMGGSLCMESEEGVGTTFYLSLPFALPAPGTTVRTPPAEETDPLARGRRVLLVEDDEVSILAVSRRLEKQGVHVEYAANGELALKLLREKEFDLILMDIQMPVMDGMETTRRIRQGEAGAEKADIPIVAVTAYAMKGDQERFLEAGMDGYLPKPVLIQDVLHAMDQALARRERAWGHA